MKVGGGRYCDPCFTLSDNRFENDILSKQGDARCPELSVYAQGYGIYTVDV